MTEFARAQQAAKAACNGLTLDEEEITSLTATITRAWPCLFRYSPLCLCLSGVHPVSSTKAVLAGFCCMTAWHTLLNGFYEKGHDLSTCSVHIICTYLCTYYCCVPLLIVNSNKSSEVQ